MNIPPDHLEIVAAIVDGGGLTEGAHRLGRSQPSVSRALGLLEARIGAALFERGRKPLRPTELGRTLARQGRDILVAREAASRTVARYRLGQAGTIRLGGTPIFMDGVVSPMIAAFQQDAPDVRIDQTYAYQPDLVRMLNSGALDLAICPMATGALPSGLQFQPMLKGTNVVACRVGHPLIRKRLVTVADLECFPWIAPDEDSPLHRDLSEALGAFGAEGMRIGFSGGTLASITSILAGSDALTVLPYSVVHMALGPARLDVLPLRIPHPERHLGMLAPQPAPPAAERLSSFIGAQLAALSDAIHRRHRERVWRDRGQMTPPERT